MLFITFCYHFTLYILGYAIREKCKKKQKTITLLKILVMLKTIITPLEDVDLVKDYGSKKNSASQQLCLHVV